MRGGKLHLLVLAVTPRPECSGEVILISSDAVLRERRDFA